MELKRVINNEVGSERNLLIVPYGIETSDDIGWFVNLDGLLIVPYGIETTISLCLLLFLFLLIVPYGIETS